MKSKSGRQHHEPATILLQVKKYNAEQFVFQSANRKNTYWNVDLEDRRWLLTLTIIANYTFPVVLSYFMKELNG